MPDPRPRRRRFVDTPIGRLTLLADDGGLTHVLFAEQSPVDHGVDDADIVDGPHDPVLEAAAVQLDEYFAGSRTAFDLPLHLDGTDFQRQAWQALADIPYGETISYAGQADAIGRPGAFRAVGAANGRNPVPIVLPCHRVVGTDGSLTGFGGGLDVKRRLLALERDQQTLAL